MSLYIGRLSPCIRRDELECVFGRFGRCNVRMKDGFGFVIYDFPPNAEKALKALQGRKICGEPLTLTWSNKQPRGFKRFTRHDRANDYWLLRGRGSTRRVDFGNRKFDLNGQRDDRLGIIEAESEDRKLNSADLLNEETDYHEATEKGYIKEDHREYQEDLPNEGGHVEDNPVDNDRWDGRCNDLISKNGVKHDLEFDHYDTYKGYEEKDKDENQQPAYSNGSPTLQSSREKIGRALIGEETLKPTYHTKFQQTCYSCGGLGHKRRDCLHENGPGRKLTVFRGRHDDDIGGRGREAEVERFGYGSRGRLHSDRDTQSMKQHENHRKASGSGEDGRLIGSGSSLVGEKAVRSLRKDDDGKRHGRESSGTPIKHNAKKARRFVSSPSDYTASRARSKSKCLKHEPRPGSRSTSRSMSSRSGSSSLSRSHSPSHCSRSRSCKFPSKSPSSESLSVSLGKCLPSSSNKVQLNLEGRLENFLPIESKEIMVEAQSSEDSEELGNGNLENGLVAVKNGNVAFPAKVDGEVKRNETKQRYNNDTNMTTRAVDNLANPSIPLSKRGAYAAGGISRQCLGETKGSEELDASMMEDMAIPTKRPDLELPISFCPCPLTSISSEEMYMALKHYALELPAEKERHLPVETYFGCARLWPWEIIYHRRLKKGPISTENYARRVAQNKKFGIVDKYIRSSSGWAELNHPEEAV
ncbi:hypothetical protein SLA2020_527930 [Shorea laevis]